MFLLCPCVQGVTYCGESSASSLTMANVPWHQEVVAFVQQLADMLPQYEIACEHEHSNCLLIAHAKVCVDRYEAVKAEGFYRPVPLFYLYPISFSSRVLRLFPLVEDLWNS